ncbi:hypothetical protein V7654_01520 [Bacillus sp. JJ1609]
MEQWRGRNHHTGCSNEGHWNNEGAEITTPDVPMKVIGLLYKAKRNIPLFFSHREKYLKVE